MSSPNVRGATLALVLLSMVMLVRSVTGNTLESLQELETVTSMWLGLSPRRRRAGLVGEAGMRRRLVADAGKWLGGRVALGLDTVLGPNSDGRFGILMYHRVTDIPGGLERPTMNVPPDRFARQVEHLLDAGYRFLTVGEVVARARAGEPAPPRLAVLTFDDGYLNLHRNVWPVLQRLQVPATVFVTTAFLNSQDPFPFDEWGRRHRRQAPPEAWQPLSWAQCREMERSGLVEIGSHTHTHRNLRRRPEEFAADLATSLRLLEDHLGPGPRTFSFPFGSVRHGFAGPELVEAARSCGVTCSLTTEIELVDPRSSAFGWGRLEVNEHDSGAVVKAKLHGRYGWMGAAREGFRIVFRSGRGASGRGQRDCMERLAE